MVSIKEEFNYLNKCKMYNEQTVLFDCNGVNV